VASVLELAGVSVRRSTKLLLDQVDWTVEEGQRWVVMGPNGAGKTTLLQIAAGALHPTVGSVQILGELLGAVDLAELRQSIGWASGSLAGSLPPRESVRDAVLTGAWGVTGRWREAYEQRDLARTERLLGDWGLAALAGRTFGTLSEGERKRVLIARSLMVDPELLLLDEPAAGLDLGGREALLGALGRLARDPLAPTTIMVTHHVEEIPEGFTHALLLRDGRVTGCGPMREVMTDALVGETFGVDVGLSQSGGRWLARGRVPTSDAGSDVRG